MKIVVITGGSRGIGAATARMLARRGFAVVITAHSHPESAEAVVRAIEEEGGRAATLSLDVRKVDSFGVFREALLGVLRLWGGRPSTVS